MIILEIYYTAGFYVSKFIGILLFGFIFLHMIQSYDYKTVLRKLGAYLLAYSLIVGIPMGLIKVYNPEAIAYQQKLEASFQIVEATK